MKIEIQPHARCNAKTRAGRPCRNAPVQGKRRCRMHGGAPGSGAPPGNKNALKTGFHTSASIALRQQIRQIMKDLRSEANSIIKTTHGAGFELTAGIVDTDGDHDAYCSLAYLSDREFRAPPSFRSGANACRHDFPRAAENQLTIANTHAHEGARPRCCPAPGDRIATETGGTPT